MNDDQQTREICSKWMAANQSDGGSPLGAEHAFAAQRALVTVVPDPVEDGWALTRARATNRDEFPRWHVALLVSDGTNLVQLQGSDSDDGPAVMTSWMPLTRFLSVEVLEGPKPGVGHMELREWRFRTAQDVLTIQSEIPAPGVAGPKATIREERFARALARACGWAVKNYDEY